MKRKLLIVVQALALLLFTTAVGVSAAQRPDSPTATAFTDVPSTNPFYANVNNISDADIAAGYDTEAICGVGGVPCYKPNNNVTRGQMAKFVDNARTRPGIAISTTTDTTPFDATPLTSRTGIITGTAIYGVHTNLGGFEPAIRGVTWSEAGGLFGGAVGVEGVVSTTTAGGFSAGVRGTNRSTTGSGIGVYGVQTGSGFGVLGLVSGGGTGVVGAAGSGGVGVSASGGAKGVNATANDNGTGVYASASGPSGRGVYGLHSESGIGGGPGVMGETNATFAGAGVYGRSRGLSFAVFGESSGAGYGVYGVLSDTTGSGIAVYGKATGASQFAGEFQGDVNIFGGTCTGCLFSTYKIDDPTDPANRTLSQAAVASPDRLNIYNGNITTDAAGQAKVALPSYFQALNKDYRYQLTVIGDFAQAVVAQEVKDNAFVIKTNKPNVKVSWQVTGVRNDPMALARPVIAQQDKPADQKGLYLYPQGYGQPASKGIDPTRGIALPQVESPKPSVLTQGLPNVK